MPKKEKIFPLSTVGGRLQDLRHKANLSRSDLYDRVFPYGEAGSDPSKEKLVYRWESGKTQLDYDKMAKISITLDCDTDYLLGLQKAPRKEYAHISEMTGLSPAAAENLLTCYKSGDPVISVLSALLEDSYLLDKIYHCACADYGSISTIIEINDVFRPKEKTPVIFNPRQVRQADSMELYNELCEFIDGMRAGYGLPTSKDV